MKVGWIYGWKDGRMNEVRNDFRKFSKSQTPKYIYVYTAAKIWKFKS